MCIILCIFVDSSRGGRRWPTFPNAFFITSAALILAGCVGLALVRPDMTVEQLSEPRTGRYPIPRTELPNRITVLSTRRKDQADPACSPRARAAPTPHRVFLFRLSKNRSADRPDPPAPPPHLRAEQARRDTGVDTADPPPRRRSSEQGVHAANTPKQKPRCIRYGSVKSASRCQGSSRA
jgi:hypothetical protein